MLGKVDLGCHSKNQAFIKTTLINFFLCEIYFKNLNYITKYLYFLTKI